MALDMQQIRERLNNLKNQANKTTSIWKPTGGKVKVRIVPYKYQPGNPFIELFFHYETSKKSPLSLKTFGEKDPICEFAEKLKRSGDKDNWMMGRKMEPKMRTFVPIVVRGKEQEGVKFWGFGKTIYEKLLAKIAEPEWGDITDPDTGRDIVVIFTPKEETGKDFPDIDIDVLPTQTPLTKDPELKEKLLDEQKKIFDVFPKPTYDELVEVLDKYTNPEAEGETPADAEVTPDTVPTEVAKSAKPKVKEGKENVEEAFDKIFKQAEKSK